MKNTIFFLMIFMPLLVLGQDKVSGVDHLAKETELEKHLLWKIVHPSQELVETTLIDDRNYSQSLINFDLDKSYNLSFTAKNKRLFELMNTKNSGERILESEPIMDFKWQLKKLN